MQGIIIRVLIFFKVFMLFIKPHVFFGFLMKPFLLFANFLALSKWVSKQSKKLVINDFLSWKRDYQKRLLLYQSVVDTYDIGNRPIDYLEFGVCQGHSYKWWVDHCGHAKSSFYGFDTFEGLPENWGVFKKGEMMADIPKLDDPRTHFIKGLFQDTLPSFLRSEILQKEILKVIHFDADLFSSTLFVFTSLYPYLNKGDILLFDEFNVPNHEFKAFQMVCESYYLKYKLIGAVNNYYQVAIEIQ